MTVTDVGGRPNNLPPGEELHKLREQKKSWTEIGERYGTSRQAVHKKWKMWVERQARNGVKIENPFPRAPRTTKPKTATKKTENVSGK